MRLATASDTKASRGAVVSSRASPYRRAAAVAPEAAASAAQPVEPGVLGSLLFVLGCSTLRFVLFLVGPERFGLDPFLALAVSATTAYYLARALGS